MEFLTEFGLVEITKNRWRCARQVARTSTLCDPAKTQAEGARVHIYISKSKLISRPSAFTTTNQKRKECQSSRNGQMFKGCPFKGYRPHQNDGIDQPSHRGNTRCSRPSSFGQKESPSDQCDTSTRPPLCLFNGAKNEFNHQRLLAVENFFHKLERQRL